jgi:hypothetical protein
MSRSVGSMSLWTGADSLWSLRHDPRGRGRRPPGGPGCGADRRLRHLRPGQRPAAEAGRAPAYRSRGHDGRRPAGPGGWPRARGDGRPRPASPSHRQPRRRRRGPVPTRPPRTTPSCASSAAWPFGRVGSAACAPAPSSSPRPGSSRAAAPPRTGASAACWRSVTPARDGRRGGDRGRFAGWVNPIYVLGMVEPLRAGLAEFVTRTTVPV